MSPRLLKSTSHLPTKDILIKQLTWEGLNTITRNVIAPVRNDNIHKWVLAACDIDIQNGLISALTDAINALVNAKLDKDNNPAPPDLLGIWAVWPLMWDCPRALPQT